MSLSETDLDLFLTDARLHLQRMGSMLDSSGVWIRSCDHRDVVAGAHISRIAQTCESLLLLCELRRAHDASVLSRVLLEHAVSLTFLFSRSDPVRACHGFIFDSLTHIGEAHRQAAKYYPEQVTLDHMRSEQAIRLGEDADYQGKFKRQLGDIRNLYPDGHLDWYNDLVYGALSIHAHPHAAGMEDFFPNVRSVFTMQRPVPLHETASAAILGWAFTLSSFAWVSYVWDLPLVESIYLTGISLIEAHPNITPGILAQSVLPDLPKFVPRPQSKSKKQAGPKKA